MTANPSSTTYAGFQPPAFRPHRLLWGGHVQTLASLYWPGAAEPYCAQRRLIRLADGDQLVLHDDCPANWKPGDRVALLVHGLLGCHQSPYMVRIAARLCARGVRTFRLDLRGCGAGLKLARWPYHSGRSEDAAAALLAIESLCPASPATLIGFSLGGNIALKLLGEAPEHLPPNLDSAIAVGPPVDLTLSSRRIGTGINRIYDRYFARRLYNGILLRRRAVADLVTVALKRRPRSLWEFDECYTAAVGGFGTAERYYAQSSALQFLPNIQVPTLILAARNDPLIPIAPLETAGLSPAITLHITDGGGHLGYIGRPNGDPDGRWLDWRVVDWVCRREGS